ncbi:hypothetical protein ACFW04_000162 [Cataglyphis niger]
MCLCVCPRKHFNCHFTNHHKRYLKPLDEFYIYMNNNGFRQNKSHQ